MTIKSGSVGIGMAIPSSPLTISGSNNSGASSSSIELKNTTPSTGRNYGIGSTSGGLFQIFDRTSGDATRFIVNAAGNVGIGTLSPGADKLDVRGRAYAYAGWQTTNADYAEWFEKEGDAVPGGIIGINMDNGKVRKYRPGDEFIGVYSTNPAYVGNRINETDAEMEEYHILVGLQGQLAFNESQVVINGHTVNTKDGKTIGILLSNGKVYLGRNKDSNEEFETLKAENIKLKKRLLTMELRMNGIENMLLAGTNNIPNKKLAKVD